MEQNIWFISDLHFNHKNILTLEEESRGCFSTLEEMNEKLIENWNSCVKENDLIFVLGDVFMGGLDAIDEIMPRLKGRKVLIRGNHDTNKRVDRMSKYFENIYDMYNLTVGKKIIVLCHYPMREWLHKEYGSIHLYGHVHSNGHRNGVLATPNSYHIGIDTNDLKPVSLDTILNMFKEDS